MILQDWQKKILIKEGFDKKTNVWFKEKMSLAFIMLRQYATDEEIEGMQSLFDLTIELMNED